MIAIGSYGMPSMIQLQARVIRHHCGEVPILVSDDQTQECHADPAAGRQLKARLLAVCRSEGLIYRNTADRRIGHSGGDLGPFYHGLRFAAEHGHEYLCKLSQRFLIDIPNWFQTVTEQMRSRERNLCSRQCRYGSDWHFHLRTECVFLYVPTWATSARLEQLRPRPIGMAAETLLYALHQQTGEPIMGCPLFGDDRSYPDPGIVWKDHGDQEATTAAYRRLADQHGVQLGDDFTICHSHLLPNYRV
jgi:hypothetical protein